MSTWKTAYESLEDLAEYKDNALGLFALGLKFGLDDLASIGVDAITDGADDKKLDIVYINPEDGYAVVGQCYYCSKDKETAPANKASDLNTGLAWLLQRDISEVPDRIKSAAINLRQAISDGEIKTIHIWYVHNLPESIHVENELITVQHTATTILSKEFSDLNVSVSHQEVGKNTIQEWYEDCKTPILINETVELSTIGGYEISGTGWSSYSTAIQARDLARLYKRHKTKIFSANIRDYLGSRKTDSNINNGIKRTVEKDVGNFWAYNNGLTILTHGYKVEGSSILIEGLSIVNGAQTTGAIGSLKRYPDPAAMVQARFIAVDGSSESLIENIIRYNNSQNKVEAADFRSTDRIQKRLKEEFNALPDAEYEGGRRGSSSDVIRRRPNLLGSYTVGQALAAFHGEPITAYNKKAGIWINNRTYDKLFNENTKAAHIVCCYALVRAIEAKKKQLQAKNSLTRDEDKALVFLRQRGAIYLATYAIAYCLETILDRTVPNLFRVSFGNRCTPKQAIANWEPVIDVLIPFVEQLNPAIVNGLKNTSEIEQAVSTFNSLATSTRRYNAEVFDAFKQKIMAP
ncbi:AIPR family protein [Vibrio alginolyticus]|uniref:AIPR family protein n=1 Tax=Vibrio harveyi group TaxID=717610 RepID=UPI001BD2BC74|nr:MULTISPECIES: AIPR family protein [Vibrio harveyi group]EGQ8155286.1 AIPR family protein [Vibrio alginolyticus]MBS9884747.1 AIPR family protein [Vibrio alginolyticus]MBS9943568.1 AIPR family protein [Vibrio alginolyticus]MBT0065481.1 AIPR family protein [Vibrio alginolyticus]MCR9323951.1 AIPR family protein [Vibrio alginolyticus]